MTRLPPFCRRAGLAGIALCAALAASPAPCRAEIRTLRDAMGREVRVGLPAARIVSLAPSVTEIVYAIGAEDLLAGVSTRCDWPVAAKLKPKAGDFNQPDLAQMRALAPQIVFFTEYARAADLEGLAAAGVAAWVLPARSVGDVLQSIESLGAVTGREEAARALTARMQGELDAVSARLRDIPEERRPRVYVEVDGPAQLYAVGPGSFMDDILRLAGGRNVFAGAAAPYLPVAPGEVIAARPEVILIDHPFQFKVGVSKRPGWDALPAVQAGRVYDGADYDIILFNRPGPRIGQALEQIFRLLHPPATPP